jgi:hypothetical protein
VAILGPAVASLFSRRGFESLTLAVGGLAFITMASAAYAFADVNKVTPEKLASGEIASIGQQPTLGVAVESLVLFGLALAVGLSCAVMEAREVEPSLG